MGITREDSAAPAICSEKNNKIKEDKDAIEGLDSTGNPMGDFVERHHPHSHLQFHRRADQRKCSTAPPTGHRRRHYRREAHGCCPHYQMVGSNEHLVDKAD